MHGKGSTRMVGRMQVTGPAPKWATDLLQRIEQDLGHRYAVRRLEWSKRKGTDSSGEGGWGYIRIRAGTDRVDTRIVLLHELAHCAAGVSAHHGRDMYRVAWPLWRRYAPSVPVQRIFDREGQYRTTALSVAKELGIRGARAALTKRRKANATGWRHTHRYVFTKITSDRRDGWWWHYVCKVMVDGEYECGAWRGKHSYRDLTAEEQALVESAA